MKGGAACLVSLEVHCEGVRWVRSSVLTLL